MKTIRGATETSIQMVSEFQVGDRICVGDYVMTCVEVVDGKAQFLMNQPLVEHQVTGFINASNSLGVRPYFSIG